MFLTTSRLKALCFVARVLVARGGCRLRRILNDTVGRLGDVDLLGGHLPVFL